MSYIDFVGTLHKKTDRNYLERVVSQDKAKAAHVASKFDFDYCIHCASFNESFTPKSKFFKKSST